ncbi:BAG family molecular chaperone regulator 2-like isoform X2 [Protopterus annectens]|uniref:BAG family molecular chaperone regulator 2-like isoform X2 n=1 Tax=Protopterus annectens TaxID=7888 RepID=UPI001CFAAD40|nr:BAG family molecular chaperone regulator 2-like isoform X2 [Protopterus annectens]
MTSHEEGTNSKKVLTEDEREAFLVLHTDLAEGVQKHVCIHCAFLVNSLREQAGTLEQEKVTLLEMIKQIKETIATQNISEGEREELTLLTDQLMIRTDAVHIGLGTVRSEQQEESLRQVTALLEDLSQELIEGGRTGKAQLESYLNACLSHGDERHADEKFQALVISCALEDQKIIRKRLESMVRHS